MLSGILLFHLKKRKISWNGHSLTFVVTRCTTRCNPLSVVVTLCHSLSLVVTRCNSLSLVLPLVATRCTTCCHSLPLVAIRCQSLSLDVPLVCLFINDRNYILKFQRKYQKFLSNIVLQKMIGKLYTL